MLMEHLLRALHPVKLQDAEDIFGIMILLEKVPPETSDSLRQRLTGWTTLLSYALYKKDADLFQRVWALRDIDISAMQQAFRTMSTKGIEELEPVPEDLQQMLVEAKAENKAAEEKLKAESAREVVDKLKDVLRRFETPTAEGTESPTAGTPEEVTP